jgi:hypothetical protein
LDKVTIEEFRDNLQYGGNGYGAVQQDRKRCMDSDRCFFFSGAIEIAP